jgi:hypothetical protein
MGLCGVVALPCHVMTLFTQVVSLGPGLRRQGNQYCLLDPPQRPVVLFAYGVLQ